MAQGAQNINFSTHPLLSALASYTPFNANYRYYFAAAGETVDKGGYSGGSNVTSAWTAADKASFVAVITRYSQVADLSFTESASAGTADFDLQLVDSVPGGWAGYAGGTTFVVGGSNTSLLTHELGHSLGLDHPFSGAANLPGVVSQYDAGAFGFNSEYYTIMSYRTGNYTEFPDVELPWPSTLGVLDIAALQSIYGANETFNNGNTTYGVIDTIETIWDGGGRDALDFSSAATNGIIDLRAATLQVAAGGLGYASIMDIDGGSDLGAYTIAYGVNIEDGFGGSGNDIITGNSASNTLNGGLGNDTIVGGDGHDRIFGVSNGATITSLPMVQMNSGALTNSALRANNYAMSGSVTIDMVLQFDTGISHHQRILSYAPDNSSDVGLELQLWDDSSPYLYVITRDGSSLSTMWTSITRDELMNGDIHRLTMTRNAANGAIDIYLNGVREGGGIDRAGDALPSGGNLAFGQSQGIWGSANSADHAFEGQFGPIAVYNTALSAAAVAARSINDLADASNPNLLSYWTPSNGSSFADTTGGAALQANNTGPITNQALNSDNDTLSGQGGNDTITAGIGDDTLSGGSGSDTLFGGAGNDTYRFAFAWDQTDVISETSGSSDRLVLTDRAVTGLDISRSGNDLLISEGSSRITLDEILGSAANRIETLQDTSTLYTFRYSGSGNGGNDILIASNAGSALNGGGGNDILIGGTGRDYLDGGSGNDVMQGGLGNDFYIINNASDVVRGEIAYSQGGGIDTVRAFVDYVQPNNIELVRLGTITDTSNLNATGNDAPGTLVGNAGNNVLIGRGGNDQLNGNSGNDTITGNTGRDTVVGGSGADTFIYTAYADSRAGSANRDVVNGFSHGSDRIDLSAMDANTGSFGIDDAFSFIGTAAFSGAGQLRQQGLGGANAVLIEGDHNGDGVADFQIFINLTTYMTASDFLL